MDVAISAVVGGISHLNTVMGMNNCMDCGGSECVCSSRRERRELRERIAVLEEEVQRAWAASANQTGLLTKAEAENEQLRKAFTKPVSRSLSGINWIGFTDAEYAALAGRGKP